MLNTPNGPHKWTKARLIPSILSLNQHSPKITWTPSLTCVVAARCQTDVVFLDFSKVVDTVPHTRLLKKLHHYGISALLHGRRQQVSINATGSVWSTVPSGVPKGTVIGPILFLIYINDITTGIDSKRRLFADDSIIYRKIHDHQDHVSLQEDITRLQMWS